MVGATDGSTDPAGPLIVPVDTSVCDGTMNGALSPHDSTLGADQVLRNLAQHLILVVEQIVVRLDQVTQPLLARALAVSSE